MQLHTSLYAQQVETFALSTENKMGGPDPGRERHMTFKKELTQLSRKHTSLQLSLEQTFILLLIIHVQQLLIIRWRTREDTAPLYEFLVHFF